MLLNKIILASNRLITGQKLFASQITFPTEILLGSHPSKINEMASPTKAFSVDSSSMVIAIKKMLISNSEMIKQTNL